MAHDCKMIDEKQEYMLNQQEILQEYSHLLEFYIPYSNKYLLQIGTCLGYNSFPTLDKVLNLYQITRKRNFKRVSQLVKQMKITGLILNFNYEANLISWIKNISFPQLHTLDLSCNKLESLDGLAQISMPNLINLNLSGNLITNIKSIERLFLQQLDLLDLSANFYVQLPDIIPGVDITFDIKVIDKKKIYKAIYTQQNRGNVSNRKMMDYFL